MLAITARLVLYVAIITAHDHVSATWISLTSITLCDLIGIEKLTNAFGLLTLARGLAVIVGPPIAGKRALYDRRYTTRIGGRGGVGGLGVPVWVFCVRARACVCENMRSMLVCIYVADLNVNGQARSKSRI